MTIEEKFMALGVKNAPGQEVRQKNIDLKNVLTVDIPEGKAVDFSHGDVDAFPPIPGSEDLWSDGFSLGGCQAYTEYRGALDIRQGLAERLGLFTGKPINADSELIITPGTQGALFLALGSTVSNGTKVAIIEPDYFANRKLVHFMGGEIVPIPLSFLGNQNGPDLNILEKAFKDGTKVFVFSTPNNPTGQVYSREAINSICVLASKYDVKVIVDQLYSRMLFSGEEYTHLRSCNNAPENLITIMGPSKTESLSGYRLGVAFGTSTLIDRMERLQAIVSLRAAGYNQAVLRTWLQEPEGWLEDRIAQHEKIRDDILKIFNKANLKTATPQAGSYLFTELPPLITEYSSFIALLRQQAQITVTPGTEFAPSYDNFIRLNFSQDYHAAISAAQRIVLMIDKYKI